MVAKPGEKATATQEARVRIRPGTGPKRNHFDGEGRSGSGMGQRKRPSTGQERTIIIWREGGA